MLQLRIAPETQEDAEVQFIHKRGNAGSADSAISLHLFLQSFSLYSWEKDIMQQIKLSKSSQEGNGHYFYQLLDSNAH